MGGRAFIKKGGAKVRYLECQDQKSRAQSSPGSERGRKRMGGFLYSAFGFKQQNTGFLFSFMVRGEKGKQVNAEEVSREPRRGAKNPTNSCGKKGIRERDILKRGQ